MRSVVVFCLFAFSAFAGFEVASIKPSSPDAAGTTLYNPTPERFAADSITVKGLIEYGYGVRQSQITGGPAWIGSDRYDVLAKPGRTGQIRDMVRDLLTERMELKIRRELREMAVYALVGVKSGLKLQASAGLGPDMRGGRGRLIVHKVTMEILAGFLADRVGRPVLDGTGIAGEFDINLEWEPDESIFTALQEQAGLRLEAQRGTVPVVVIEHVERPSPN